MVRICKVLVDCACSPQCMVVLGMVSSLDIGGRSFPRVSTLPHPLDTMPGTRNHIDHITTVTSKATAYVAGLAGPCGMDHVCLFKDWAKPAPILMTTPATWRSTAPGNHRGPGEGLLDSEPRGEHQREREGKVRALARGQKGMGKQLEPVLLVACLAVPGENLRCPCVWARGLGPLNQQGGARDTEDQTESIVNKHCRVAPPGQKNVPIDSPASPEVSIQRANASDADG